MANPIARVRIGRVRLKEGGELRLLPSRAERERGFVEGRIRQVLDDHGNNFAGFALVVWGSDGTSSADMGGSDNVPFILIPDLVRNRLLALKIEEWSRQ